MFLLHFVIASSPYTRVRDLISLIVQLHQMFVDHSYSSQFSPALRWDHSLAPLGLFAD